MSEVAAKDSVETPERPGDSGGGGDGRDEAMSFRDRYLAAYRWMILARLLEEKLSSLYRAGQIVGGVYVGKGQEAFSVALASCLDRENGDVFGPLIRDQAGRLAFGEPILDTPRTYFGSVKGPMRGRDGNVHRGRPSEGMTAMISHLGATISVVCGMLMAKRFKGEGGSVGGACIGDGGTSTGSCHEALNLAGVEKLPLVVAIANNRYAYSTHISRQFACRDLVDRAIGYGFTGHSVDGTDLRASLEVFEKAVAAARDGDGPQMVVGSLLRLAGHGEHDDFSYITEEDRRAPYGRDCLEVAHEQVVEAGWANEAQCAKWVAESAAEADLAIATAQKEPGPDPYGETWGALATTHLNEGYFVE